MFMLRMIGSNSGDFVCTQVLHNLWKLFLFKKYTMKNDAEASKTLSQSKTTIHDNFNSMSTDEDVFINSGPRKSSTGTKLQAISKLFKEQKSARIRNDLNPKMLTKRKSECVNSRRNEFQSKQSTKSNPEAHKLESPTYTELKRKLRAKQVFKGETIG